jgi:hypothetical protein
LQAIYDQAQENERDEKSQWARGGRSRLAIEWRWIYYGIMPETGSKSLLRRRLKVAGLVDPVSSASNRFHPVRSENGIGAPWLRPGRHVLLA